MIPCFVCDESAVHSGKYTIRPIHNNFHLEYTEGSFNLIGSRLMGLTYAQYLRMCRDCYNAEIIGKKCQYPVAYFKSAKDAAPLVKELNERANKILNARR